MSELEKLNNYAIQFAIESLKKSSIICGLVNLNNQWEIIVKSFKNINEKEKKIAINKDILLLISSNNMKMITENIKGFNLRYMIVKLLIENCYYHIIN